MPPLPVTQPRCIPVEGRGEIFRTVRAFANLHSDIADAVIACRDGSAANPLASFPTVEDSVLGVTVVNVAVASSQRAACWVGATLDLDERYNP